MIGTDAYTSTDGTTSRSRRTRVTSRSPEPFRTDEAIAVNIPETTPRGAMKRLYRSMVGQGRRTLACPSVPRLDGKLALVTGATGGIGAEIARGLAQRGAELILPCRSPDRGHATVQALHSEFGASCPVQLVALDLVDLDTVTAAAERVATLCAGRPIDILVENAGIWPTSHRRSAQGHEIAFAVNVLRHFALRQRLLERGLLPATRVIVLTGDIYILQSECTSDYRWRGAVGGTFAYCRSKLGNMWIAAELARRHPELAVFIVHPGVVATNLGGDAGGAIADAVKRRLMIAPEQGAQTALICATQEGLRHGGYYHNTQGLMHLATEDPAANHTAACALWEECVALCAKLRSRV